jgi:hypothetical protein
MSLDDNPAIPTGLGMVACRTVESTDPEKRERDALRLQDALTS